ncbi:BTAD domain-containing putative transcriptional regulator [Nonomuraea sp. NPDC050556]|uniref:AfsR/SARP family transcriptional regulator n=1 Tax=Nonomuraea sp. NPDC050556 TaxID=3364369 RepID=UPI003796DEAC
MRFEVLGPVRGWRDDDELELGSPQQRLTLAALLLAGGRVLGADQLLDMLWGQERPRSAMGTLRTYISRLRAVLGPSLIVSVGDGYQLAAAVDVNVFSELVAQARDARPQEARALLGRALDLWRGEPLAGLSGAYAEGQRVRLGELRLSALEARIEADLSLGRHVETVAELTSLSAAHPERERLRGLLMRALYLSGRQAEAIGVYTDTRRLLAEELGIDPSPELAELYQQIITADAELGGTVTTRLAPPRNAPRQLPADVADFTGRAAEISCLVSALSGGSAALPVSIVAGPGGVGKTTLAVHVAHRLAAHYPDGQLFVDLQGTSAPGAVLGAFLRALGEEELPEATQERSALFRSLLAERRMLVVLDNAVSAAQVRPLLPGAPGCAVLVTSRARLVGLGGARQVDLEVLSPVESLALLAKVAGEERVRNEHGQAMDLVAACGFLPLAIRIAAARLAARPQWSIARLRDRLADERRRLAELRTGNLAVEASFSFGYDQLPAPLSRAFRLLALPEAATVALPVAAALLGVDRFEAEDLCEALVDLSMLESPSPGRYHFHDLLKVFARGQEEPSAQEALVRALGFYTQTVEAVYRQRYPGRLSPQPGAAPSLGIGWLIEESESLLSLVQQAIPFHDLYGLAHLLELVGNLMGDVGAFGDTLGLLLDAAIQRGDVAAEAFARYNRSTLYTMDPETSRKEAMAARDLALACGDTRLYGYCLSQLALLGYYARSYAEAIDLLTSAGAIAKARGDLAEEASVQGNIAVVLSAMGGDGLAAARRAYELKQVIHGGNAGANGDYSYALVLAAAGESAEALSLFSSALAGFSELRQREWMGSVLVRMAGVLLDLRRPQEALERGEEGLALLIECGDEVWQGKALLAIGRALTELGAGGRAHACLGEALEIFERLDLPDAEDVRILV